jgi:hypothetical protein
MYLDLTRYGYIQGGLLYYPSGPGSVQAVNSYLEEGVCGPTSGSWLFAPTGTASVAGFLAPFSLERY